MSKGIFESLVEEFAKRLAADMQQRLHQATPARSRRRAARSPHAVLGVPIDADAAAIRKMYLELVREHHPDRHVDDPPLKRRRHEKRMREINEAYGELKS